MNVKTKFFLVLSLFCLFFLQNLYISSSWFSIDFTYLIIIFISLKSTIFKTGLYATIIGLIIDTISGGVLGVYGFSRTLVAFLIRGILTLIDLKKGFYVFLITTISLSLSNLIANFLMFLIFNFPFSLKFLLFQPIFTGLTAYFILKNRYFKQNLDVY